MNLNPLQVSSRDIFSPYHVHFSCECGKYSASVFCHLKFPKIHWPYKNSLHKFAPPRGKSIRWVTPFVTRRIHQHVYLLLSPQSTCSYSLWSRSLSSIYSALPSRRHKTSIQIRTDAQWPDYHGQNNCGKKPNCLSLRKSLNCNGQIGHWSSLDTIKHRGPASEP